MNYLKLTTLCLLTGLAACGGDNTSAPGGSAQPPVCCGTENGFAPDSTLTVAGIKTRINELEAIGPFQDRINPDKFRASAQVEQSDTAAAD